MKRMNQDLVVLLPLLPSLDALLRERNVTRAARLLGISQPRLSDRLKRLRALLRDPLLVPATHGRGMVATPRAEQLRDEVATLLRLAGASLDPDTTFDPRRSDRTFRLLCTDQAAYVTVPILVSALRKAGAPGIKLAFYDAKPPDVTRALEQNRADFVFTVSVNLAIDSNLKSQTLFEERSVIVFRRGSLHCSDPIDLDEFCQMDHVVLSNERGYFTGPADAILSSLGRERRVMLSLPTFMLVLAAVAQSDLIAIVPYRLVEPFSAVVQFCEIPFNFPRYSYVVAWHPRLHVDPGHRWLRNLLQP